MQTYFFRDDPKGNNTRRVYGSTSSRGREIDEVDSGVGSSGSQPSSPATSSVSSVDTTTDDLIDFSSKTSTFPRGTKQHALSPFCIKTIVRACRIRLSHAIRRGLKISHF